MGKRIISTMALAAIASFAAVATPELSAVASVEKCGVLFATASGKIELRLLPALHLLSLKSDAQFSLPPNAPPGVKAVECGRQSIVPTKNDYKVLAAGFVLDIVAGERIGALEIVKGQLRFRMIAGQMTDEEGVQVQAFLNESQPMFYPPERAAR